MRDDKKTKPYSGKQIDKDEKKGKTSAYDKRSKAVSKQEENNKKANTRMGKSKDNGPMNTQKGR
jgi:hypothetical protein